MKWEQISLFQLNVAFIYKIQLYLIALLFIKVDMDTMDIILKKSIFLSVCENKENLAYLFLFTELFLILKNNIPIYTHLYTLYIHI